MGKIFGDDEDEKKPEYKPAPAPAADAAPAAAEKVVEEVAAAKSIDVTSMLDSKCSAHAEDLDWKKSIVDLMKLLDMDSSYGARKELALELGYTQGQIDNDGSAEMNMWLHKQVLFQVAQNGGNVPDDLLA